MSRTRRRRQRPTFPCPHCGEPVPAGSSFCRECGSDAGTGWSEEAEIDGLDLPEPMGDVEYEEFLAREFPSRSARDADWRKAGWKWGAGLLAAVVLLWALLS